MIKAAENLGGIVVFLHIGGEEIIPLKDVIAIIDIEKGKSPVLKEFLYTANEEGFIKDIASNKEKSLIITNRAIYLSPISSLTLKKRSHFIEKKDS
jgi:hypothetical protein